MNLQKILSYKIFEKLDMEAIHLILTWLWIVSSAVVQFCIICWNIKRQTYLSCIWKFFIVAASAFLLGQPMIHCYCICLMISNWLRKSNSILTEKQLKKTIDSAMMFASMTKLGEIFTENIPQFLTQLLMTSAKGKEGVRELSALQMLSVGSSAISISFGLASHVIKKQGRFCSNCNSTFASSLVLLSVILSEIAFCGGVCRFAFVSFDSTVKYPIAFVAPFVALSSILVMAPIINDKYRPPKEQFLFLGSKVTVWVVIVGISISHGSFISASKNNNSFIIFIVTMTLTSSVNFWLGYYLRKSMTTFALYNWIDALTSKMVEAVIERPALEHSQSQNSKVIKSTDSNERDIEKMKDSIPTMGNVSKNMDASQQYEPEENHLESKLCAKDDVAVETLQEMTEISGDVEFAQNPSPNIKITKISTMNGELDRPASEHSEVDLVKESQVEVGNKVLERLSPLFCFIILFGVMFTIFKSPLNYTYDGYQVEFHVNCLKERGFPIVRSRQESKGGSICVHGKSPEDIIKIALVVGKHLQLFPHPHPMRWHNDKLDATTILTGEFDYNQEEADQLKTPFLYPNCRGDEGNLKQCQHYGLSVGLPDACYNHSSKCLYVSILRIKVRLCYLSESM